MALLDVIIVDPDGAVRKTEIENDLRSFQAVVGGYIEAVIGPIATVYVNEEGLIQNLPFNPSVTLFAHRFLNSTSRLHGTALIVGPPDEDGLDTHVRQSVVSYYVLED